MKVRFVRCLVLIGMLTAALPSTGEKLVFGTGLSSAFADTLGRLSPEEARGAVQPIWQEVSNALKGRDFRRLATYVHPEKGLRFSPYPFVNLESDLVFHRTQVARLGSDSTLYTWGIYDGSGEPIRLTFEEYYRRFVYDRDFAEAPRVGFNTVLGRGNMADNVFDVYPGSIVVECFFPGFDPKYEGMDWESLRLVFQRYCGAWFLVGIVHAQWTI